MTVRWMTPNSSSGAGVAGDAILRGGSMGGDGPGDGLRVAMLSVGRLWVPQWRGRWVQGSGLWAGERAQKCEQSQRLQSGGACPGEQMERRVAGPGEQAHSRGGQGE